MPIILHIALTKDWRKAQKAGKYQPKSLGSEGFIHCCTDEQIVGVGWRICERGLNLVLLEIDSRKVEAKIKREGRRGNLYPHIYGPINLTAVTNVSPLDPNLFD